MQKRLTIALDLDYTLIGSDGELNKDMYDLFLTADLDRTTFLIITGNNLRQAKNCIKKINEIMPKGKHIDFYLATSCNSHIYDKNGNLLTHRRLSNELAEKIEDAVYDFDKNAVIMYRTNHKDCLPKESRPISAALAKVYEVLDKTKKEFGVTFHKLNEYELSKAKYELDSMYVMSLKPGYKTRLVPKMKSIVGKEATLYDGSFAQICAGSKIRSLVDILKLNAKSQNPDPNMPSPENYKEVIFFGDGSTDIDMFRHCFSIARREKYANNAKLLCTGNLQDILSAIFADESVYDSRIQQLLESEYAMK